MNACRACTSEDLYLFLPLGDHPLANGFLTADQLGEPEPTFPLDVYSCLGCGLIQVDDNVPAGFFRNYVYVPSASDAMKDHFGGLARMVARDLLGAPEALVVDIGCNDGLFLTSLQQLGGRTLGVDPASNIAAMARAQGVEVVNEYFDRAVAARIRASHGPASVIVTTNTFHHIGDLDEFTAGMAHLLADDGVAVVEVPHALAIVEENQFDGVYHEHVSQFTVLSVVKLARRLGLEVFRVDPLEVHGGSLRVFLRKPTATGPLAQVEAWTSREERHGLLSRSTYDEFGERVDSVKQRLLALLSESLAGGRRIAGYGSSARGNTLLNYFEIGTDVLDYIVDRNPLKHGLYTPGRHIPVLPAETLESAPPDDLLVLAWNFADEILAQQAGYRAGGGRFIVPIPEPRVV